MKVNNKKLQFTAQNKTQKPKLFHHEVQQKCSAHNSLYNLFHINSSTQKPRKLDVSIFQIFQAVIYIFWAHVCVDAK